MTPVEIILYLFAFIVGLAFMPVIAYGFGGLLPGMIAEPLANLMFSTALSGYGRSVLEQQETGEYRLVRADEGMEPRSYWSRFAMVPFGVTFEVTKRAFGTLPVDVDPDAYVAEPGFPFPAASADMDRGGVPWYVDLRERASIHLPIGEALASLRGAAGLDLANESVAEALKEHGGDTSSFGPKLQAGGFTLFTFVGLGMGYVIFF